MSTIITYCTSSATYPSPITMSGSESSFIDVGNAFIDYYEKNGFSEKTIKEVLPDAKSEDFDVYIKRFNNETGKFEINCEGIFQKTSYRNDIEYDAEKNPKYTVLLFPYYRFGQCGEPPVSYTLKPNLFFVKRR